MPDHYDGAPYDGPGPGLAAVETRERQEPVGECLFLKFYKMTASPESIRDAVVSRKGGDQIGAGGISIRVQIAVQFFGPDPAVTEDFVFLGDHLAPDFSQKQHNLLAGQGSDGVLGHRSGIGDQFSGQAGFFP